MQRPEDKALPKPYHSRTAILLIAHGSRQESANDDLHDNFFLDPAVGRFPAIAEDERPVIRLVSDR